MKLLTWFSLVPLTYWGLRDYGDESVTVWGGRGDCEHKWGEDIPNPKYDKRSSEKKKEQGAKVGNTLRVEKWMSKTRGKFCVKCGAFRGQLGLEPHPQMFIDHMALISREVRRILKKSGSYYLVLGDTYCGSGMGTWSKNEPTGKQVYTLPFGKAVSAKIAGTSNWLQPKQLLLMPSRVAIALQHDGWILRNDNIWYKSNHMPSSVKDRRTTSYEHIFHLVKSRRYYYDLDSIRVPHKRDWRFSGGSLCPTKTRPHGTGWATRVGRHDDDRPVPPRMNPLGKNPGDIIKSHKDWGSAFTTSPPTQYKMNVRLRHPLGKNPGDFLSVPTRPFKGAHFAVFSEALVEPFVKSSCPPDGLVFDPFCGSGTTCLVAKRLGRNFLGCDIVPEYVEMSRKRVAKQELPLTKIFEGK